MVPPLRHQPVPTVLLELQQRFVSSGGTSSTQPMLQYIPGENGHGLGENLPKVLWVGQTFQAILGSQGTYAILCI